MSRMNVEFSEDTNAALERLADSLGTSKAGALRFGIALLGLAIREQASGNTLGVVRDGRVMREIVGVWSVPSAEVRA